MNLLFWFFSLHDVLSSFVIKHLVGIKRTLLLIAHFSLFGLLFPEWRRSFGQLAEIMLLLVLFLSPISKILGMRLLLQLMSLRRELGIWMAYLATVHVVGYFIDPDWAEVFWESFRRGNGYLGPPFLFGVVAYICTLSLLLTSNNLAQRLLGGKHWKNLHRLAYPLLVLVLLHHLSMRHGLSVLSWFQFCFAFGLYLFLKLLAVHKNIVPPIRRGVEALGARYRAYTATLSTHRASIEQETRL